MNPNQREFETETVNAFDKEHAHEVIIIQLMRLYDIMLAQLSIDSPQKAAQLVEMHDKGLSFMPAPSFSVQEEQE
ncbi:hypothetical protein SEA_LIMPID_3 [Streptomyces phage Limpid]|uniref:Uncharacterized protein n=1 Tax=Streptomyces phage Limpid TaxID=2653770 RepID=A0A5Q2WP37_9CAUD|nr:hypothetical protein SEA_LIMPID_3 [Streptomyces phage Limpid]